MSHWNLSISKSPKVSRTLLSILANLNYWVVWMVSSCPLIFKSSLPIPGYYSKCDNCNWYHRHLQVPYFLVLWQGQVTYLSFPFLFFLLSGSSERSSRLFGRSSVFVDYHFVWSLADIRWSVCISKSKWILCVTFSRTDSWSCIYYLYYNYFVFFKSASADGLSVEYKWQEISSGQEDSSQYFDCSQECCINRFLFVHRCPTLIVLGLWNSSMFAYYNS